VHPRQGSIEQGILPAQGLAAAGVNKQSRDLVCPSVDPETWSEGLRTPSQRPSGSYKRLHDNPG
jgi:hypothetical protein